ncbi:MAG: NFACT RNA binding domain-containing protein [Cyanobacteriota bacterium]|nr:NFACT RNA binding domain-containing protein [Cyanobacteriota bacterium]
MGQPPQPPRLQPIDATTLRALVAELRVALVPSRFEKAQQPDGQTLQLALRHLDGVQWLELGWLAEAPRLLAIPAPPRKGEGSTLAAQLQHGLRGLALVALHQAGLERVVRLDFAARPGEAPRRHLVLELMGRHSNLFLLNEQGQVIALARQVRLSQSRWRPIGTGDAYTPPPEPRGEVPRSDEPRDRWQRRLLALPQPLAQALLETYQGVSPSLVRQLLAADRQGEALPGEDPVQRLDAAQWDTLWRRWRIWLAAVEGERFSLGWDPEGGYRCWGADQEWEAGEGGQPPLAIHRALAEATRTWLEGRHREQRRHALRHRVEGLRERERRQAAEQESLLAATAGSDQLQHEADALLCLPTPTKEQIQEAQRLYKKARKQRRSVAAIQPRLEGHRQRLAWLEDALVYADQADQLDQLAALEEDLQALEPKAKAMARARARPRSPGQAPAPPPQPLELRSPSGLALQVGRNHRQNEWISFRQARRGDLWFHAQEVPGSHVVLKASEGPADDNDLAAAADLAAHFSRGRGNARVPVVMVPIETLQRLPGAGAGTVRHRGGEILWGQPDRAQALLIAS